ncbi:Ada metal-binding domain-containing protein [Clostridium sp. AN503]|uniref:bifunctional transcriptional activator/DNA repair enzyme AdaA n=1 Tax=Clostridium sp. AN503 TaxID=3160598 RepID=UPI0034582806
MTEQEMWQAVLNNDAGYDGVFFYAVKTTGIYCRPSCKSKPPKKENICFFETSEQARKAGFRPCKRCRSDLIDYQPMKQIAEDVKCKIEKVYCEQADLCQKLNEVGITGRRLADIFKDEYGMTPKAYADHLRLAEAKRLLKDTDKKVIDIAYSVGFGSLSAFYSFFKKEEKITPSEYRRERKNKRRTGDFRHE